MPRAWFTNESVHFPHFSFFLFLFLFFFLFPFSNALGCQDVGWSRRRTRARPVSRDNEPRLDSLFGPRFKPRREATASTTTVFPARFFAPRHFVKRVAYLPCGSPVRVCVSLHRAPRRPRSFSRSFHETTFRECRDIN